MFYWNQPFLVGLVGSVFSCSIERKPFSVDLVVQLFQPALSLVETVENDGLSVRLTSIGFHVLRHYNLRVITLKLPAKSVFLFFRNLFLNLLSDKLGTTFLR